MALPKRARSGGPQTVAGRAVASKNSVKTGAYALQVVLPGEETQEFDALKAQLLQDFAPIGMAEASMVHDLAVLIWKKLRVDRVEHAVLSQLSLLPLREEALEKCFGPGWLPAAMPRLEPFKPVDKAEYDDATTLVAQATTYQNAAESQRTAVITRRKWPQLYAALQEWADDYMLEADELLAGAMVDGVNFESFLRDATAECQKVSWLWENREQLARAMQQVRDARLLEYMKGNNNVTQRAFDDIGRTFYRTLSELRRQQDWRLRRSAINVEDISPAPTTPA